jgi:HD-GYP domain-containing protein (c-di-GMP phosphodiesterase class II)
VSFILPPHSSLSDLQYVLELSSNSPAKFASPPSKGSIGCNDSHVFGKPGDGPAVLRIDDEKVEPLIMSVGEEDSHNDDNGGDDAYEDDQAEADHEEQLVEEERQIVDSEIEKVEKDVIEALEEKRLEIPDNEQSDINAAKEEVFQALEDKRKDINRALNSIKDEIIIEKAAREETEETRDATEDATTVEREREIGRCRWLDDCC